LSAYPPAPEWHTSAWLNCETPLSLSALRGRVVVVEAFQMLCPACVLHALPQAQRLAQRLRQRALAVVGLHCVFEHHAVMTLAALRVFLDEYRIRFPVGVDAPDENGGRIPRTMRAYAMQGTPTTVLIDAAGRLRRQWFGAVDDLELGVEVGSLLAEAEHALAVTPSRAGEARSGCDPSGDAA